MGFLSYDEQTGLVVKTKANILEDLKELCKQAYGQSFVVVEGTEMYSALDLLASAIAEDGSSVKAVYDDFGFMGAKGIPLDVLCSLAGIARKQGESDTALRARYYKFLYTASVGTLQGLEAQILSQTISTTVNNQTVISNLIDEVKITNNDQSSAIDFLSTGDLLAHSIAAVCKHSSAFPLSSDTTKYANARTQISETVKNYKSLGCGVLKDTDSYNYIVAEAETVNVAMTLHYDSSIITSDEQKGAIINQITENLTEYIKGNLINQDLLYSAFGSCVFMAYNQLGYTSYAFELVSLTLNETSLSAGGKYSIAKNKYAKLGTVTITFSTT